MIQAVIFDMDGVIIDSEIVYIKHIKRFFDKYDISYDENELLHIVGSSDDYTKNFLYKLGKKAFDSPEEFRNRLMAYYKDHPVDYEKIVIPETVYLIRELYRKQIPMALASSSRNSIIEEVLEVNDLKKYFPVISSGEDFKHSKPDPEIYLVTADKLGIEPSHILVIEDSDYGIEAALSAGMTTVARKDDRFGFRQDADYVFEDLRNVKILIEHLNKGENIKKVRYGSKDYLKSLFLRNRQREGNLFSEELDSDKERAVYNYMKDGDLLATIVLHCENSKIIIDDFASSKGFDEETAKSLVDRINRDFEDAVPISADDFTKKRCQRG